jgi:hypothetical protein
MVMKNGVAAIPFLVLVNREGIAIALNTRGPALGEKLAELFPDAAPASEPPAAVEAANSAPSTEKPAVENESAPAPPAVDTAEGIEEASE